MRFRPLLSCLLAISLAGAACDRHDPTDPSELTFPDLLTPAVRTQLTGDGLFALHPPPEATEPRITAERAADLALAIERTLGSYIRSYLETQHGQRINFDQLQAHPRIYFAETPFERVPHTAAPVYRRHYGPFFLVQLHSNGTPVLSVGVSAYNTSMRIDEQGKLVYADIEQGGEFFTQGVPIGGEYLMPISPERAAEMVARAVNARVAAVPELVLLPDYYPQFAQWKVSLDRDVSVRGARSGRTYRLRDLYVGLRTDFSKGAGPEISAPVLSQPRSIRIPPIQRPPAPGQGVRREDPSFELHRKSGLSIEFEPVTALQR